MESAILQRSELVKGELGGMLSGHDPPHIFHHLKSKTEIVAS